MRWRFGKRRDPLDSDPDRAYARWAPFYPPRAHNRLMEVEEAAVRELLPPVTGRRVLDAGCGTGRYLEILARSGAASVIGVDRSVDMLRGVRAPGAHLVRGDVRHLPLADRSVDAVVCGLALMDVAELDLAIREMARVLDDGGVLVYSTLHSSGSAEGWRRTFETPEGRQAVKSWWHPLEEHLLACRDAGLTVDAQREPVITDGSARGDRAVALVIRAIRIF